MVNDKDIGLMNAIKFVFPKAGASKRGTRSMMEA